MNQERDDAWDSINRTRESMDIEIAAREMERMDADEFERQIANELGGEDDT